jgi:hypothetical protein
MTNCSMMIAACPDDYRHLCDYRACAMKRAPVTVRWLAIEKTRSRRISAANFVETALVIDGSRDPIASRAWFSGSKRPRTPRWLQAALRSRRRRFCSFRKKAVLIAVLVRLSQMTCVASCARLPGNITKSHLFCFGGFRRRTPGPPPFSSMNSRLANSKMALSAASFAAVTGIPPQ